MVRQWDALEADFARFYHLDLAGAVWVDEPMSARRFAVLVGGLPAGSATVRREAPEVAWGLSEHLLATVCELVDLNNRMFFQAHAKQGTRPPEPLVIGRPGRDEPPGGDVAAPEPTPGRRAPDFGALEALGAKVVRVPRGGRKEGEGDGPTQGGAPPGPGGGGDGQPDDAGGAGPAGGGGGGRGASPRP